MNENNEKIIRKCLQDIGLGAWMNIHGWKFAGKKGRNVYFDIKESEVQEFDKLYMEYFNSLCCSFDSALMNIKKMGDYLPAEQD